jgi:hypothetical protein
MRTVITLMLAAVTGWGCKHQAPGPPRLPQRGSCTGQEELVIEEHDALVEDLADLYEAYDAMVDPDASDEQIQEAQLKFRFLFLRLRFFHGRAELDQVRNALLRQYEVETGRPYKPTTRPSIFPADD